MCYRRLIAISVALSVTSLPSGCTPGKPNDLDKLSTTSLTIKDQPFKLWIADENEKRLRGLMFITEEQMAPLPDGTERGMIFVFDHEQVLSFWMKNTIIPLDIAYLDTQGKVLATYTMAPLDDRLGQYSSRTSARFAIEVNAGVLGELGVQAGDAIDIPDSLLEP